MAPRPTVVLFHRDLRIDDNPALLAAASGPIVPVFILDEPAAGDWSPGGASRWWLHHSLQSFGRSLEALGAPLVLRRGDTVEIAVEIVAAAGAGAVFLNRNYEPWMAAVEDRLHRTLQARDVTVKRFRGRLLEDPDRVRTKTGDPYKVYTPFWRAVSAREIREPVAGPDRLANGAGSVSSDTLSDWGLLPTAPDWATGFAPWWQPGESAAHDRLATFLDGPVSDYKAQRDRPDLDGTSRLSPHLHFGEIPVARCWQAAHATGARGAKGEGVETFLKELVWREFAYHLLHQFPQFPESPFAAQFGAFPWAAGSDANWRAWTRGQTGIPIIDAGMRQLWSMGWMHNRVRMIVGSFLTKNLLIPWQRGEAWFWDCLVDADLASNSVSWQWVAGSGADAAPYFRVFNPVKQSETYDPDGAYIKRWVPELERLPATAIHAPWEAPASVLRSAGVVIGRTYPAPIVDLKVTRQRALDAYATIKRG